jgi:methionine-rich copper-binding protein CopC
MSAASSGSRLAAMLVLVTVGALALPSGRAWAHTQLESSTPAEGSLWSSPPATAQLVFSSAVDPALARVSVAAPDGTTAAPAPVVQGKRVTVPLQTSTAAGGYVVDYRVVSWDGHTVAGRLRFRVSAASSSGVAPVSLSSSPAPAEVTAGSSLANLWPVILAVLVTTVAAWTLTSRRRGRPA